MNTFVSLCLVGSLSLGSLCYAQYMDNDAKKKVIKDLDNLLALNRSAETKVINAAISKLNSAGRDPGAAYDLLIQSKKFLMETEKEKDKSQGKSAKIASNSMKDWMDREANSSLRLTVDGSKHLRYGENPHQGARFYGEFDKMFTQLHGKEISYNNFLDIDAAVSLIKEFDKPTFAVLKHNNACGIASRGSISEAWDAALACDPVSAFGGVLVCNGEIQPEAAEKISKIFFEVIIAPGYAAEALEILKQKKNRIILLAKELDMPIKRYRSALNGILEQDADFKTEDSNDMRIVTTAKPDDAQTKDLIFANKVVKHSKSNAIVLAKGLQLMASGVGQTSRVDALKQAIEKARSFGFDLKGASMASDAFFPFSDCVEIAHEAGIEAVVHPGGSIRDQESIDFCETNRMTMAITGNRHFRH